MQKWAVFTAAVIGVAFAACGGQSESGPAFANVSPAAAPQASNNRITLDHDYQGGPFKTILVIGILKDPELKRRFENHFVERFRGMGLGGVAGYNVIPDGEMLSKELVQKQIEETHIDSVLIARIKGAGTVEMETARSTAPDSPNSLKTTGVGRNDLFGHYAVVHQTTYEPGFAVTAREVEIEMKLFEVTEGRPVWGMTRTTINPRQASDTVAKLSDITVEELTKAGLIE